jgi:hypothetical protein
VAHRRIHAPEGRRPVRRRARRARPDRRDRARRPIGQDRWPDYSPAGIDQRAHLQREALRGLDDAEAAAGGRDALDDLERRCARLLRERLQAQLAVSDAGSRCAARHDVQPAASRCARRSQLMPPPRRRTGATSPPGCERLPQALDGYRRTLETGGTAASGRPRQVAAVVDQLGEWGADGGWFAVVRRRRPAGLARSPEPGGRRRRRRGRGPAAVARRRVRAAAASVPGRRRPRPLPALGARLVGRRLDLDEAYAWAGRSSRARRRDPRRGGKVLPGRRRRGDAPPRRARPAVDGVDAVRLPAAAHGRGDRALDGVHFDLAEPVRGSSP